MSGWVDKRLKEKIRASGLDESGFIEYAIIRSLMRANGLDKRELQQMIKEKALRPTTVLSLRFDKII